MGLTFALLGALLLALLAWLWWVPLRLTAAGVLSTERASHGRLDLQWWPLACAWLHEPGARELRIRLFGVTVWRGPPSAGPGARHKGPPGEGRASRFARWPSREVSLELARFAGAQAHRIELSLLTGTLQFGFEEPDLTGVCMGALHLLESQYPAATRGVSVAPCWTGPTRLDVQGGLRVGAFAGRMVLAAAALGLRLWRIRTRARGGAGSVEPGVWI